MESCFQLADDCMAGCRWDHMPRQGSAESLYPLTTQCKDNGNNQYKLNNRTGRNFSNLHFKLYEIEYKIYYIITLGNI